jgi:UDP-N-acetylglucosamine acyltransferase
MKAHATSIVDAGAEIAGDVEIGPYAIVGAGVRMGAGCRVAAHAVVLGPLTMGQRNEVCSFAALGGKPQIKKREAASGDAFGVCDIGDDNVFREHVTVHRGTESITRIGSHTLFMVGAHVAHDVTVGSHCVIANAVQLAGHVVVEDYVTFGGLAGVAQLVVIGESAFVAAGAMVERDVPPYCIVQGDRARVRALNRVGLERRGVPRETIAEIERVFRAVFLGKRPRHEILRDLTSEDPLARKLLVALR